VALIYIPNAGEISLGLGDVTLKDGLLESCRNSSERYGSELNDTIRRNDTSHFAKLRMVEGVGPNVLRVFWHV